LGKTVASNGNIGRWESINVPNIVFPNVGVLFLFLFFGTLADGPPIPGKSHLMGSLLLAKWQKLISSPFG
jgi:hypothetical protein